MQAHALTIDPAPAPAFPPPTEAPFSPRPPFTASAPAPVPASWTASLLAPDASFSLRREAARFGAGLGLAALYGAALGARAGGSAFLAHAIGVPAAIAAVCAIGVPALYIALALFDAPIEPTRAAAAAVGASARTGLVLAGLAPAAALFVVSSDRPGAAAFAGAVGLVAAGAIGLARLLGDIGGSLRGSAAGTRTASGFALAGFGVFAVALAVRIWWALLPVLGGAR